MVLLIEDDDALAALVSEYLTRHGFVVERERRGDAGARRILRDEPDLVVLDLFLPGQDGRAVLRTVRKRYRGPILMLTASQSNADHVAGLELGADDFVTKPIDPRVLLARIRTLLRRVGDADGDEDAGPIQRGQLELDPGTREARYRGVRLELTSMEFDVLALLAREAGRVVTRDDLYERVAGIPFDGLDRGMDVHVSRIRRKLAGVGFDTRLLKSVRGQGYLLGLR